jgi:hypothetical protein
VDDYCKRLGKYRQPFGWGAVQVFDPKGNLLLGENCLINKIYVRNPKDDLFDLLHAVASNDPKEASRKLGKELFGIASISVERIPEEDLERQNLCDASLQMVRNSTGELGAKNMSVLYQVHEFPQFQSLITNFYYVNNLYIYPIYANLSSKNGRNVAVKMEVKDNDTDASESLCVSIQSNSPIIIIICIIVVEFCSIEQIVSTPPVFVTIYI